jgi:hypothetical protein
VAPEVVAGSLWRVALQRLELGNRVADMTVVGFNAAYRTLRASDLTRVPADLDVQRPPR